MTLEMLISRYKSWFYLLQCSPAMLYGTSTDIHANTTHLPQNKKPITVSNTPSIMLAEIKTSNGLTYNQDSNNIYQKRLKEALDEK